MVLRLRNEFSTPPESRALHELRTIQYLEETVGPAGLRRLADALLDDDHREVVQGLRRRAANASLELESIIEEWNQIISKEPRKPKVLEAGGLDASEIIETFIEVKRSSGELLRRAAAQAPNEGLAHRLKALAEDEVGAAAHLETIARDLPRTP